MIIEARRKIFNFGFKIADIRVFRNQMFGSSMKLINHTSTYNSIRSLPTKFFDQPNAIFQMHELGRIIGCNTVASSSYNRCTRVSIWQRGNFTVTIWSMTMFRSRERERERAGGVTKRDATRIVKRGRNGEGTRANKYDQISLFPFSWLKSANIDFIPGQLPPAITRNMGRQPCGVCSWVPGCLAWSQSTATPVFNRSKWTKPNFDEWNLII